jgi:hypothetical protein
MVAQLQVLSPEPVDDLVAVEPEANPPSNRFAAEDREAAYVAWKLSRSLKQTADVTGVAIGTLRSWSQRDSWVKRAESEDAERAEIARSHILNRVSGEVTKSVEVLIAIRDDATASNRDRRQAAVDLLGIFGINVSKPDPNAFPKPTMRHEFDDDMPTDNTPEAAYARIQRRRESGTL